MFDIQLINHFRHQIENATVITIVPHHNPDGDALGSALGLCGVLLNMDKNAAVISPNEFPSFLSWMPGANLVMDYSKNEELAKARMDETDLLVMVDFNCAKRVKQMQGLIENFAGETLMIDHHPEPDGIARLVLSDTSVSSTCELVYSVLKQAGYEALVDVNSASCFYTGIMTDTGLLNHNSSQPQTYHIVADFVEKGINKDEIHQLVFHNNSLDRMRLLGYSLSEKMIVLPEIGAAYIALTADELNRYNYLPGDTEGFVNYPLGIEGVNVSALFTEKDDMIKISLRSRGGLAVNKLSETIYGGGGHHNAAGGESFDTMEITIQKFVEALNGLGNKQ
jgi:phosphoesterase RecJ-like protein